MIRNLIYAIIALAGGAFLAIQAPINARLKDVLRSSPLSSALVSVMISMILLAIAVLVAGRGREVLESLGSGPWWAYLGGGCGVVFLVASLVAVSHQGVTVTFVAVVAGQMLAAMIIDRWGLLGVDSIAFGWHRTAAVALICGALALLLTEHKVGP